MGDGACLKSSIYLSEAIDEAEDIVKRSQNQHPILLITIPIQKAL